MADAPAFRGYIASRPVNGVAYPHRVQNLVIHDYCARRSLPLHLSATEVALPGSFMALNDLLSQLGRIGGIVLFSQFTLPPQPAVRRDIYGRILAAGCALHAALERLDITTPGDIAAFDATLMIAPWLERTPFHGVFAVDQPGDAAAFAPRPEP